MTVAVAGSWELGYSVPLMERDLWLYPLREYEVDAWFMAPVSGIDERLVTEMPDLAPLIDKTQLNVVFVDENGATELSEFEHPSDVLYVCGKASFSPMAAYGKVGDASVRITTPRGSGMLWPHQAICLVLQDRMVKAWR